MIPHANILLSLVTFHDLRGERSLSIYQKSYKEANINSKDWNNQNDLFQDGNGKLDYDEFVKMMLQY